MKRYLFLLLLPLLFATCKEGDNVSPNSELIGRWSLVAQRDTAGAWQPLLPLVPVVLEFRRDGSVDYLNGNGQPQRGCCQPTQYATKRPEPCPINASCLQVAFFIDFTDHVLCPNAYCALVRGWTVFHIDDTYLDIYASNGNTLVTGFRYQRIR
ncbi:hypothetical protein [Fibrella aquatica]|uniref:hypothetical protein n=1 Tax=Fibrella aquatica TaxID=3242487 RepID=UPI00352183FE